MPALLAQLERHEGDVGGPRITPELLRKAELARKFFVPLPPEPDMEEPDYGF